ncbi:MAG: flagellar filament capping protein FliD [Chromatiales bacterium]|nr:flagellar filament capping protein FliD [Chromatiales bacterium]
MTVSSPGIGSGLDISGIVSSLISAEGAPATARFDRNESNFQAKLSALGLLKSSLSTFQGSLTTLKDITTFQQRSATSTDSALVSVSADSTASVGSYSVAISRLAQTHKMASAQHLNTDTFGGVAGDQMTVTVGLNTLTVDLSTAMTLDQLSTAITTAAGTAGVDVTSTVITGNGGIQELSLTSNVQGYTDRVQIGGNIDVAGVPTLSSSVLGLATINTDANGVLITADTELDSQLTVNGLTLTRSSNSITDVITGVTLDLKGITTAPETVEISLNTASVTTAVNGFVKNYNDLMKTITDLSAYDPATGQHSVLLGDATLRTIEFALRNELSSSISGVTGSFNSLSSIGITTERDGSVTLNSTVLDKAIASNFDDIGLLFGSTDGVATRLDTLVDGYASTSGVIDARIDGLNTSISNITDQRTALSRKLSQLEARYFSQFNAMDLMVSQLQSTSTYLSGAFANLPGSTFNKK